MGERRKMFPPLLSTRFPQHRKTFAALWSDESHQRFDQEAQGFIQSSWYRVVQ